MVIMVSTLYGQKNSLLFSFSHFTTKDGLSSNNVNSVIQDQKGFLWIGTEDGLNRFDGYSFKVYRNKRGDKSSLSNNFIWSLCEDKDGKIWIGTDGGGLNRLDPVTEKFERFVHDENDPNSVSSNIIQSVFVDSKNNLWISTWGGGLNFLNQTEKSFKRFRNNPDDEKSIGSDKIFFTFEDSKSRIWVGTEGGLNLFDDKSQSFIRFKHNPLDNKSISFDNVTSMLELNDGNFLISTSGGGLNKFFYEQNKFFKLNTGEFRNVWKMFKDRNNNVWAGSSTGEGVCVLSSDLKTFTILKVNKTNPVAISSNDIRTFYEDRTGVLWIGTVAGGLNKIDRKPKKFFQINESN